MNTLDIMMSEGPDKNIAMATISRPIPKELIKQRDTGYGKKLDYIGGETVISLLNEAFNGTWSYEIIDERVIESVSRPLLVYNNTTRKKEPVLNADQSPKMEPQPPYIQIRGRLSVPGFGVREQYGTKIFVGGASEQEGAAKAAATDSLKKCATLFGIGLELYGDKEVDDTAPAPYNNYNKPKAPTPQPAAPAVKTYKDEDIKRLKELKAILGIPQIENNRLNPYVEEFTGTKDATYEAINPDNITRFNKFLEKKAEKA